MGLHEIVSFTSGRLPFSDIWYPGPFPYTAVVKRFLSLAIERDMPVYHRKCLNLVSETIFTVLPHLLRFKSVFYP